MDIYLAEPITPFQTAAGAAFNTFTTKKSVDPLPIPVIPAGKLRIGSKIALKAVGEYSSLTGASLTMGFWFGTRALAITGDLALSSVFTTGTTPTNWPWEMEWEGVVTAVGTAGSIIGQGKIYLGSALTTFLQPVPIPITQALRTVAIDTTIERAVGVSATWGASSGSNQIIVNTLRGQYWN